MNKKKKMIFVKHEQLIKLIFVKHVSSTALVKSLMKVAEQAKLTTSFFEFIFKKTPKSS